MQKRNACRRQEELNWRNAFYVKIVIFAHKTTLSEDGCKRCLQLRRFSSEYKFRGEEEEQRVGELKFCFDAEEKVNCARYVFRRRNSSSSKCSNRMTPVVENSSGSLCDMKKNIKSRPALIS
ncbi:hypothetical protein CDAR_60391 [Caerostris darwini]|uniref:Uncharacterized protein n=1 Tax=Caerostris darwini TaxID=1538125 RepID=A0AAV4QN33_9ARAC|nr:hypothetical protein CDAR_60391 [Caerostris darwini]